MYDRHASGKEPRLAQPRSHPVVSKAESENNSFPSLCCFFTSRAVACCCACDPPSLPLLLRARASGGQRFPRWVPPCIPKQPAAGPGRGCRMKRTWRCPHSGRFERLNRHDRDPFRNRDDSNHHAALLTKSTTRRCFRRRGLILRDPLALVV
jgi:hypothetical protein